MLISKDEEINKLKSNLMSIESQGKNKHGGIGSKLGNGDEGQISIGGTLIESR